jgi:hypothetical protein
MPDFTAQPTAGVTIATWEDPESDSGELASRAYAVEGIPHLRWTVERGVEVVIKCTPDGGSEGDPDASLGGRLFTASWIEKPIAPGWPALWHVPGFSSVIRFTPATRGHYTLQVYRPEGGAVILHFDRDP